MTMLSMRRTTPLRLRRDILGSHCTLTRRRGTPSNVGGQLLGRHVANAEAHDVEARAAEEDEREILRESSNPTSD